MHKEVLWDKQARIDTACGQTDNDTNTEYRAVDGGHDNDVRVASGRIQIASPQGRVTGSEQFMFWDEARTAHNPLKYQ